MHPAIEGALIGGAIGVALTGFEYLMISKAVNERAKRFNRKAEFDVTDRRRIATIGRFSVILPFAFAAAFWWIWG
jgi:hypothetical protein